MTVHNKSFSERVQDSKITFREDGDFFIKKVEY